MLDDILWEWHRWATGWSGVAAYGSCAMFADYRSPRQWGDGGEIADASIHDAKMRAVDFHIIERMENDPTVYSVGLVNDAVRT